MIGSAYIGHVLNPLIDPAYAAADQFWEKSFANSGDDRGPVQRDHVRGLKRFATNSLDWSGDKILLSTKENPGLRLIDVERGEEERVWSGEWMCMQVDPNNPHIAAAVSWRGKFKLFDTRSADKQIYDTDFSRASQNMKEFLVLRWSPDSNRIALNNRSDQVFLLDKRSHDSFAVGGSTKIQMEVNQMVWSADSRTLWAASGSGRIYVLPVPELEVENAAVLAAHQNTAICLAADASGRHIASGGSDCLVALWDPKHLQCTRTFGYATHDVTNLDFNHTGSLLAWGTGSSKGGEKNLTIVCADTGALLWQDATPAPVQHTRWHPKRNLLAYALNPAQLPDDRERDGLRDRYRGSRDPSVLHLLRVPEL